MNTFFLLGQIPDGSYHHRIIHASNKEKILEWWVGIWGDIKQSPCLVLSYDEFKVALGTTVQAMESLVNEGCSAFALYVVEGHDPNYPDVSDISEGATVTLVLGQGADIFQAVEQYQHDYPNDLVVGGFALDHLLHVYQTMQDVYYNRIRPDEVLR